MATEARPTSIDQYASLRLAVLIRAPELCEEVVERKSILFDGSDVTRSRCLHDVGKVIDQDISMARRLGPRQRIDGIDLRQNGNGRDYDFVIANVRGCFRLVSPRHIFHRQGGRGAHTS